VATADFNVALAADPGECRFRLPTLANSRFGLMLAQENGRLKPVLLAPLLGGAESRMRVGEAWQFRFHVIAARLRWRQGQGPWQSQIDEIYPYEFSPELRDDGGDFACVLEVEDPQQKLSRSPVIVLPMSGRAGGPMSPPADAGPIVLPPPQPVVDKERAAAALSADFLGYLEHAANGTGLGLRDDGRYYPYSTPQGRRIAWRQPVWDLGLFAHGSTRDEAEQHLRAELGHALDALKESLAARQPPVDFTRLDRRQQETLLDFAHSEGAAGLHPEFVAAVLAGDWPRVMNQHLYVRYAGHAPDHPRNKAYADRWSPAGVSAP